MERCSYQLERHPSLPKIDRHTEGDGCLGHRMGRLPSRRTPSGSRLLDQRHRLHGIKLLRTASDLKNTPIISTHTAGEKGSRVKRQRHSYCIRESIWRSKSDYDRSYQGHFHVLQGEQYYLVCKISRRSEQCESRRIVKEEINTRMDAAFTNISDS